MGVKWTQISHTLWKHLVYFSKILKNYTKYCNFFEITQNFSFAIWVSNKRKFHIRFGNINCVFRKYSKITQNTVTFSKLLKILVLQYGCQINANFTYIFKHLVYFSKILKKFTKYCIYIHFGNIQYICRKKNFVNNCLNLFWRIDDDCWEINSSQWRFFS